MVVVDQTNCGVLCQSHSASMVNSNTSLFLLALWWLTANIDTTAEAHYGSLRGGRRLQAVRPYSLLSSEEIRNMLLDFESKYPNLVKLQTAQDAYGLPVAGDSSHCPFDENGCLNYILTIQDFVVCPQDSTSSNALPEVLWSGALHGDERVGPTAVMEAAFLLSEAASCEASYDDDASLHASCSEKLEQEYGISRRQRQWLARLVATRRIVIVPTDNALGYYESTRNEGGNDVNRDFPFDYTNPTQCMLTIGGRTLNEVFRTHIFQMALTFHAGYEIIGYEWGADSFNGVLSPDDEAQHAIATALSALWW